MTKRDRAPFAVGEKAAADLTEKHPPRARAQRKPEPKTVPCVHVVTHGGCNPGEIGYYSEAEVLSEETLKHRARFKVAPEAEADWLKYKGAAAPDELAEKAAEAPLERAPKATRPRSTKKASTRRN